jgi:hypothetical protein
MATDTPIETGRKTEDSKGSKGNWLIVLSLLPLLPFVQFAGSGANQFSLQWDIQYR